MTDKKFTQEQIIKGLEICTNGKLGNEDCINCPYESGTRLCSDYLMLDSLDLINHLTTTNKNYEATIKRADELIDTQKAENAVLQHKIASCNAEIEKFHKIADRLKSANATKYSNGYKVGYTKATKEFAERLKVLYMNDVRFYRKTKDIVEEDLKRIDNLVKEMTEGK